MCDVGVKIFTIFFKKKIHKKTCKKFCRLQKDLYLCSVNKKTTKHMIKLGYKKGDSYCYNEISIKQYEKLVTMSMYNVIKFKNVKVNDFHILVVSRETYNILIYLINNEVDF